MRFRYLLLCLCLLGAGAFGCDEDFDDAAPRQDSGSIDADETSEQDGGDAAEDGEDADADGHQPGPGSFDYSPAQITFRDVEQGESATKSVLLKNLGESELLITDLRLVERADGREQGELLPGERWIDDELAIPPDIGKEIDVKLEPTDYATDRGYLEISVLADTQTQHVVPIESINAYADIDAPSLVRMGSVAVGESQRQQITIYNRGVDVLTVDEITYSGSDAFSYEVRTGSEVPDALERGEFISLDVLFEPESDEQQSGRLTVENSDPDDPSYQIRLRGNEPLPCIRVSTRSVDFGDIRAGEEVREALTILNCSLDRTLEVSNVSFSTSANGAFTVEVPDPLPLDLLPTQTTEVDIVASGDEAGEAVANLTIRSNDTDQSPLLIDVRAVFE